MSPGAGATATTASRVVDLAVSRAPSLGSGRLLVVDGPAGSGKTTFAEALRDTLDSGGQVPPDAVGLVHLDDLYPGWDGLPEAPRLVHELLLGPLSRDEPGHYRRYDWVAQELAEQHVVPPRPWLVVEGVGAGAQRCARLFTVLVWVEADDGLRLARGIERDGEELRPQWERWMREERVIFARERTRERADVVVGPLGELLEVR